MELSTQKSKSRMRFFTRRTSSNGSNFSFKSVGSTFSFSRANSGSKDESFFESKGTFESDADEDFQSVQEGDSTPSETATPNNSTETASSNLNKSTSLKPAFSNSEKETVPSTGQKVMLVDLLKMEQDSTKQEQGIEDLKTIKMEKLSSIASRASSVDGTPDESKILRNRGIKAVLCCVPCLAFNSGVKNSRKKKTDTSS